MAEAFAPGTPVVLRGLFRRRIWVAQGAMVVSDSPERTVLALVPGSECRVPALWAAVQRGEQVDRNHWDDVVA